MIVDLVDRLMEWAVKSTNISINRWSWLIVDHPVRESGKQQSQNYRSACSSAGKFQTIILKEQVKMWIVWALWTGTYFKTTWMVMFAGKSCLLKFLQHFLKGWISTLISRDLIIIGQLIQVIQFLITSSDLQPKGFWTDRIEIALK